MNKSFELNKGNQNHIAFAILLLFFLARQEPLSWILRGQKVLLGLCILFAINYLSKKFVYTYIFKELKYFFYIFVFIILNIVFNHGSKTDLLKLLLNYFSAAAFYIIGFYLAYNNQIFLRVLKYLYTITIINLLPFLLNTITTFNIHKRALALYLGMEETPMIIFWPYLFLIGFVGFYNLYYTQYSKNLNRLILFLFVAYIALLVVSSFAAVVMMFVIATMTYYFIQSSKFAHFKTFLVILISSGFIYFSLSYLASGALGELGGTTSKINAFLNIFSTDKTSNREELFDQATATRWSRLEYTWESIADSPFVGIGYEFGTTASKEYYSASGHSSVFDFIAYFGAFSSLFFILYLRSLLISYKLIKLSDNVIETKILSSRFGMLLSFFAMSFMNPYFQHTLIEFVFLISGLNYGQYIVKIKNIN